MIKKTLGKFNDANGQIHTPTDSTPVTWRISVYGLIQNEDKIFFTKPNWSNQFELPGGGVEVEETLYEALSREVKEESGLELTDIGSVPFHINESNFYYSKGEIESFNHSIGLFFRAKVAKNVLSESVNISDKNIIDTAWIKITDINAKEIHPMHLEALKVILEKNSKNNEG